jgi:hypothetical protein
MVENRNCRSFIYQYLYVLANQEAIRRDLLTAWLHCYQYLYAGMQSPHSICMLNRKPGRFCASPVVRLPETGATYQGHPATSCAIVDGTMARVLLVNYRSHS